MASTCAVPECYVGVPKNHLMCLDHWRKVSPRLRTRFFTALHAFEAGRLGGIAYQAVVNECIAEAKK